MDAPPIAGGGPQLERTGALLERAYQARKEGDAVGATGLCREALQLQPDYLPALSLLGQLYEAMGDRDLAIHTYERLVQLYPSSVADRGRLDDLRGEGKFPVARTASAPHVLYTGVRPALNPWQAIGFAAAGAALVTLGGLFALRWREPARPIIVTPPAAQVTVGKEDAASKSSQVAASTGSQTNQPVASLPNYMYPPTFVDPAASETISNSGNEYHRVAPAEVLPPIRPTDRKNRPASSRIQLPPAEASDDAHGDLTIRVKGDHPKTDGKNRADAPQGMINIKVDPPHGSDANAAPTDHDARSFMALGDTLKLSRQYDKAIAAYRRALAGAGDDTGRVYQQIADCFRKHGDKESAINNYRSAIAEYQKLIDASRNVEYATDGLRVCEKAIKVCSS